MFTVNLHLQFSKVLRQKSDYKQIVYTTINRKLVLDILFFLKRQANNSQPEIAKI